MAAAFSVRTPAPLGEDRPVSSQMSHRATLTGGTIKVGEIEVLLVFDGFGYEVARDALLKPYNSSAEGAQKASAEVTAAGGAALAVQADLRDDTAPITPRGLWELTQQQKLTQQQELPQ